ncbi:hypothetical protein ACWCPM_31215, partial [Streptomyces sp. NPDC002309]
MTTVDGVRRLPAGGRHMCAFVRPSSGCVVDAVGREVVGVASGEVVGGAGVRGGVVSGAGEVAEVGGVAAEVEVLGCVVAG